MSFSAEIVDGGGGGHAVVVPADVAAGFSVKRPPVLAVVNGVEYRSRLARYGGKTYLGLRKDLLRQIDAAAGDAVEIELTELEEDPKTVAAPVEEPAELVAALTANASAKAAYHALPASHQQEYCRWIAEAKKPVTRAERAARTIKRLTR